MGTSTSHTTIESSLDQFLNELNKSLSTIQAYRTDIQQLITWLHANDVTVIGAFHVTSGHIKDYLRYLADQGALVRPVPESWFPFIYFLPIWCPKESFHPPQLQR